MKVITLSRLYMSCSCASQDPADRYVYSSEIAPPKCKADRLEIRSSLTRILNSRSLRCHARGAERGYRRSILEPNTGEEHGGKGGIVLLPSAGVHL
jgi:hypothetical protein